LTKAPWKYQKAEGHHHVLLGDEVLDVNNAKDAKLIALVPDMIETLFYCLSMHDPRYRKLLKKIRRCL